MEGSEAMWLADAITKLAVQVEQLSYLTHLHGGTTSAQRIRRDLVAIRESIADLLPPQPRGGSTAG